MVWVWGGGITVAIAWLVFAALSLPGLKRAVALQSEETFSNSACSERARLDRSVASRLHAKQQQPNYRRFPKVSVILTAKNEAGSLPDTLASLQKQTWPNLEVIAVDDRSTDETPNILHAATQTWPELKIIYNKALPVGWLGKTYALYTAARQADGEWLLFTDADVRFSRDVVEIAVQYALNKQIDHLALSPRIIAHGFWLRSAVYFFLYNVILAFRPQNADVQRSSASVGIGAFNLIHKNAYESTGGHRSVALRTDEDLALGEVIKKAGFRQVFAGGTDLLSVEWYASLSEMTRGLEKNALAPFRYRFWRFSLAMAAMLLFYSGPALGTLFIPGWTRALFAASLLTEFYLFHMTKKYSGISSWWALTLPLASPLLCFILVRAAILAAVRGGIQWRGTFYSLEKLRRQK